MKKMFAALVLMMLTALVGCIGSPQVDKGGGESAVLVQENGRSTGQIDVQGHVVNSGGSNALNVALYFKFFQAGTLYLEEKILLGGIDAGASRSFSGTFFGPPVDVAAFTWEYRIEWD